MVSKTTARNLLPRRVGTGDQRGIPGGLRSWEVREIAEAVANAPLVLMPTRHPELSGEMCGFRHVASVGHNLALMLGTFLT